MKRENSNIYTLTSLREGLDALVPNPALFSVGFVGRREVKKKKVLQLPFRSAGGG